MVFPLLHPQLVRVSHLLFACICMGVSGQECLGLTPTPNLLPAATALAFATPTPVSDTITLPKMISVPALNITPPTSDANTLPTTVPAITSASMAGSLGKVHTLLWAGLFNSLLEFSSACGLVDRGDQRTTV